LLIKLFICIVLLQTQMKHLIYIFSFLLTSVAFSQNTGLIVGKILDNELNNSPLVLANVAVKGTNISADTDISGLFTLENLEDGDYTLVCSFVGYETKEINIHVNALEPTELKLSLAASTLNLSDILSITSTSQKEEASKTVVLN
jgi:hypothetical protein